MKKWLAVSVNALVVVCVLSATVARSAPIPVKNASFELPKVDPNAFPALPMVDDWMELDLDELSSSNTGVFANTPEGSPDRLENADGDQLAFLGSQQGNALEQVVDAVYGVGCDYRLTAGVGISNLFPPSASEPADAIELVLYYVDGPNTVDIASRTVEATGLSSTELTDCSVSLPVVEPNDPWAGMPIGIAIRAAGAPGGFWDLDNVRLVDSQPVAVAMGNASFGAPVVGPNAFPALPFVEGWIELDLDTLSSSNTGVFANTPEGSPDRLENADGNQLAFLGSQMGNALEQTLEATYEIGCDYQLTVGVGVSNLFPPSTVEPVDAIEIAFYYPDGPNSVEVARRTIDATGLSSTQLQDFSLYLPAVASGEAWAGLPIGVAIRAAGMAGGFWDLDNVRLLKSQPEPIPIENASFELPVVDANAFAALPLVDGWRELDLDELNSSNTGVFANTQEGSPDRLGNADGNQLAFLGSQEGNALEQTLKSVYQAGRNYRLTVGVGVSSLFPPSAVEPVDSVELVLYYVDGPNEVDIANRAVEATGLSSTELQDSSVSLLVQPDDAWAGKPIGIAIRATGAAGGFWDLDTVRLAESVLGTGPMLAAKE